MYSIFVSLSLRVDGFGLTRSPHFEHFHLTTTTRSTSIQSTTCLFARGRRAKAKQTKSSSTKYKRNRQGVAVLETTSPSYSSSLPKPTTTQRVVITLKQALSTTNANATTSSPLQVCTRQITDPSWWEHEDNINPYGARNWPSAFAVAQFLVHREKGILPKNQFVLELGCGCGLISIAMAQSGATVLATDISKTVLTLTQEGWKDTQKQMQRRWKKQFQKKQQQREEQASKSDTPSPTIGSLSTSIYDLFSKTPLPIPEITAEDQPRPIVVAAAMMYEGALAQGLARRALEAARRGAWVIIGDDDTGERERGRSMFEAELDRLEKESAKQQNIPTFPRVWVDQMVQCQELGWAEKRVKLFHLNPPSEMLL